MRSVLSAPVAEQCALVIEAAIVVTIFQPDSHFEEEESESRISQPLRG